MPFTEHLRELRNRLLISLATVGAIAVVLFWPSQYAIHWMMREYLRRHRAARVRPRRRHLHRVQVLRDRRDRNRAAGAAAAALAVRGSRHPSAHAAHGLRVHRAVARARGARAGLRALRRDPARGRGADPHHRRGRHADVRSRLDAQLRDGPARALCDRVPDADRADRIGAPRHRERRVADALPAARALRVLHRRRSRRARRQPAHDGAARRADVSALRDVDLGDSAAAAPMVVPFDGLEADRADDRDGEGGLRRLRAHVRKRALCRVAVRRVGPADPHRRRRRSGAGCGHLLSILRRAAGARDPAPEPRQRLPLAVVRRHHRLDLAVARGVHVQARHSGAAPAAASGERRQDPAARDVAGAGHGGRRAPANRRVLRLARLGRARAPLRRRGVDLRRPPQLGAPRRVGGACGLRDHRRRHDALLGARFLGRDGGAHGQHGAGGADARPAAPRRLRLQDRSDHDEERHGLPADRLRLARHRHRQRRRSARR